ncbi:hypothetical protein DIPPA_01730 [Diplonema papillatum]|nr:hypothetical protein DIPPA_01730 [Diplonema papillatum]
MAAAEAEKKCVMARILDEAIRAGGGLFVDENGTLVQAGEAAAAPTTAAKGKGQNSLGGPQAVIARTDVAHCPYERIFCRNFISEARGAEFDDMLWFVAAPAAAADDGIAFIRRRTDPESHPPLNSPRIDWRATLFTNIITQWEYSLTVAVCRSHVRGRKDLVALNWVRRRVYAQPSSVDSLEKDGEFHVTFPNVFFTVDDFAEAFGDMRLEEGQGWCVELVAINGERRIPVFRGAVPFEKMIRRFDSVTKPASFFPSYPKKEAEVIDMKGPGGRGSAQAAVFCHDAGKGAFSLHCCLTHVSATWIDLAYCLENPAAKAWLHIPTEDELEEERRLNDELKAATQRANELSKLAEEDEKPVGTPLALAVKLKSATASASKWFDSLKENLSSKKSEEKALPFQGTRVVAKNLKQDRWKHLNGLEGVVMGHHPSLLNAVVVRFPTINTKASLKVDNIAVCPDQFDAAHSAHPPAETTGQHAAARPVESSVSAVTTATSKKSTPCGSPSFLSSPAAPPAEGTGQVQSFASQSGTDEEEVHLLDSTLRTVGSSSPLVQTDSGVGFAQQANQGPDGDAAVASVEEKRNPFARLTDTSVNPRIFEAEPSTPSFALRSE